MDSCFGTETGLAFRLDGMVWFWMAVDPRQSADCQGMRLSAIALLGILGLMADFCDFGQVRFQTIAS